MAFLVRVFTVPKSGHGVLDNQDSVRPRPPRLLPHSREIERSGDVEVPFGKPLIAAVADGASEGTFSAQWARIILSTVDTILQEQYEPALHAARQKWTRYKKMRSSSGKRPLTQLPDWLEQAAVARGAFSTLCAVTIQDECLMTAVAIGDSCMFHVRGMDLVEAWPIGRSEDFGNTPYLLPSEHYADEDVNSHWQVLRKRKWETGDVVYLATDALSQLLLKRHENREPAWRQLDQFDTTDRAFSQFIDEQRAASLLRNDDTSLVIIRYSPEPSSGPLT